MIVADSELVEMNDVDSLQRNESSTRHSEVRVCEVTLRHQRQEQSQEKGRLSVLSGLAIGKRPAMFVVARGTVISAAAGIRDFI